MTILFCLLPLLAGLALLTKGADVFVDGASGLAAKLGVPSLVVGLTIVALGTSAPEAAISVASSVQSADGLTIANVFGSNIVNTLVILGLTALMCEVPVRKSTLRIDIPLVVGATALLLGLCLHDGVLGRADSALLLLLLAAYLTYLVVSVRGGYHDDQAEESQAEEAAGAVQRTTARLVALTVAGAAAICVGAHFTVEGATQLATLLGMTERVVGLTVVAVGTSLPELVTSLTAARKGQTDIALGNVVGSSLLNVLFVLGVSGVISPIPFAPELVFDGVIALGAIALVWIVCVRNRSLGRWGGASLLASYAVYLGFVLSA